MWNLKVTCCKNVLLGIAIQLALDTTSYVFHGLRLATLIQDGVEFDRRGVSNRCLHVTRRAYF
jgi:hypothetical protein